MYPKRDNDDNDSTVIRFDRLDAALDAVPDVEDPDENRALEKLTDELTGVLRKTSIERDKALMHLDIMQQENRQLISQREEIMRLLVTWQQHAARLERFGATLEREMDQARLEHQESQEALRESERTALHTAQRALDLAADVLASRWLSKKRKTLLDGRLTTLLEELDTLE